jgi:hypothetical protein
MRAEKLKVEMPRAEIGGEEPQMNAGGRGSCAANRRKTRGGLEKLLRQYNEPVTVRTNNTCSVHEGLNVLMLVAVKKELRMGSRDVVTERNEAEMNFVVAIVNEAGGIVSDKNAYGGKGFQGLLHFWLFEEVVALWFVLPGTAEAAKGDTAELKCGEVEVAYWGSEWAAGVVVAFYGENFSTAATACDFEDGVIGQVPA